MVVVETAPPDELPVGLPGPARPKANRNEAGEFAPGAGTSALAREGARAAHESRQLASLLGFYEPVEGETYAPYTRLAREHREAHGTALASSVGGGQLSPGVTSILASASLALAASRYLYDRGAREGDPQLLGQASRLADQSRTSLLTAHELAAREAAARAARDDDAPDPFAPEPARSPK
jgi:hypothetical protein